MVGAACGPCKMIVPVAASMVWMVSMLGLQIHWSVFIEVIMCTLICWDGETKSWELDPSSGTSSSNESYADLDLGVVTNFSTPFFWYHEFNLFVLAPWIKEVALFALVCSAFWAAECCSVDICCESFYCVRARRRYDFVGCCPSERKNDHWWQRRNIVMAGGGLR
jgi:hypothetical protein